MTHDGGFALTPEQVRHITQLAALELADDEVERLASQLGDILRRFAALEESTTEGTEGLERPPSPLRPDEPGADPLSRSPAEWATAWAEGFFTVPRLASHDDEEAS